MQNTLNFSNGDSGKPVGTGSRGRKQPELTAIELCAGGGGAALGLEEAGFSHAALIDNNSHACATLRQNRPYWNVIEADIKRFCAAYWKGVDLVSAGLPCPPFSIAGKQLGADDDRNMFPAMLKIVNDIQPRAVLIENVRGILTSRFKLFRTEVNKAFDDMDFDCHWAGLNAADYDVPQFRFRAFLVALKRGATTTFEWPERTQAAATVGETIFDLMAERGWHSAREWADNATAPAPTLVGGSHKHGGPDLGPTRARKEWAKLGVDGLGLADAPPEPHFRGMPRLTVPMVARLQSFPDEWKFTGGKTQAYRQIGNALPVRLAYQVGRAVRKCLE